MTSEPPVFLTDRIFDMVATTYDLLEGEWYQKLKKTYLPVGYRRDMKTFRLQLPRRCGTTTAAFRLWEAYPTSHLYMPKHVEMDLCRRERMIPQNDRRTYVIPHDSDFSYWSDKIRGHEKCEMVIFDGASRMKPEILEDVCHWYDEIYRPNLFALLG